MQKNLGLVLLLILWASPTAIHAQPASVDSCKKFVQNFYDWYEIYGKDYGSAHLFRPHSFSAALALQLKEDSKAQSKAKGYIVGLDWDPFFATNGGEDTDRYFVTRAQVWQGHCFAGVHLVPAEDVKGDIVTAELQMVKGQWQFVNFHYPAHDGVAEDDLLTILNNLREDRRKQTKNNTPSKP